MVSTGSLEHSPYQAFGEPTLLSLGPKDRLSDTSAAASVVSTKDTKPSSLGVSESGDCGGGWFILLWPRGTVPLMAQRQRGLLNKTESH